MAAPGKHRRHEPIPGAAVYALCEPGSTDPTPRVVRYIGQTRHGMSARWRQHLRRPAGSVAQWINSLDDEPVVLLLEDMAGANLIDLTVREHDLIDEYRSKGAALLNTARRPPYARQSGSDATSAAFTAEPRQLPPDEVMDARWSVYLMRFDLTHRQQLPALKIGMVGSGTISSRLRSHQLQFGPATVLAGWSLDHAAAHLDEVASWRLTEQYEARLQFAPEFAEPTARLRRLRPDTLVYSYEWFEDDERVIDAVNSWALRPVTLPHGWNFAREDPTDPALREQPRE